MAESSEVDADLKFSIIPEWLLDSEVSHKAIRIYALIARYADNQTLTAWPARGTLATRAKCTVKSVDRAITELIEAGAIGKELRRDEGGQRSSVYTLKRIRGGDKITIGGRQNSHRGGDKIAIRTITNELEPIESMYSKQFELFWSSYPHKVDKARARKAFRKIDRKKLKPVVEGAQRFAEDPNLPARAYIPYPATWLNGERWEDGPLPARSKRGESKTRAQENLDRLRELERESK
jgi:hypothetical protein